MSKRLFPVAAFGLTIVLALAAGCVPLPAATDAGSTPSRTSITETAPTVTPVPTETGAVESASGPTVTAATPGPTVEVSTAQPSSAATPTQAAPGQSRAVTLADNGKTVTLQPGDRFLLNLGEGYNWDVSIADQEVISRVIGVLTIRGSQGVFEAHQAGETTLTATGDPECRNQQPACAMPSVMFKVQIVVTSGTS